MTNHAVAVLIISPKGIPLVRDPKKPAPIFWKLPGGRSIKNETPEKTAIREIKEETGLMLKSEDIWIAYSEERDDHNFFLIQAIAISLEGLKSTGNDGEEVKLFLPNDLKNLSDFFHPHKEVLEEIKFF
ncbi:hypothetical protein COV23_02075 [Candidatus Wolfebacteria bacterium CG10_big_fil_rev_8_21_14_0_10_31_9]|uniref:Nudix hydrolase domain-containing protein n=1 Tax=Candidatus Wolfebacteria bacterium CG10_big_fil_rev_8_21_14_0_10_31_9 TaxID=1975070 RepID=A0A2H0RBY1_9BACT|nr:MAG: hypothetical protein COV23_02075 [Candidatus Wolfebacteria bacterium CG10_big_fil_rev_8_21_14_0_10_31_9]